MTSAAAQAFGAECAVRARGEASWHRDDFRQWLRMARATNNERLRADCIAQARRARERVMFNLAHAADMEGRRLKPARRAWLRKKRRGW